MGEWLIQEYKLMYAQSCPTLSSPIDCSSPGPSVHGISQTRLLERIAISSFRGSSWPKDWNCISHISCMAGGFFTDKPPGKPWFRDEWVSEVTQLCPTLCDPMDCSLPGSSIHGIFQARVLEWLAISFSRGSSQLRDRTWVSCIAGRLPSQSPGKPIGQGKHKLNLEYWLVSESRAVLRKTKGWRHLKGTQEGTSLMAQWLRLWASNARGVDLLPGQATKSPHATWCSQKSIKNTEKQTPKGT